MYHLKEAARMSRNPLITPTFRTRALQAAAGCAACALAVSADAGDARPQGLAVIALEGSNEAAWPLAKAIYARSTLRPASLDEARARVLAGEPLPPQAPAALRDLAETRVAVHGDDAPSRHLLSSIAQNLHVRGLVVVGSERVEGPVVTMGTASDAAPPPVRVSQPFARVYLVETGSMDAARYYPDDDGAGWASAARSLERSYGVALPPAAPGPLTPEPPKLKPEESSAAHPFYSSPWFWGALGAAAVGATAVYFATQNNGNSTTIHLSAQVPK